MRAVSVPFSPARPSRLKNEPGILPAAYMRSSTSTVSGRKSTSRRLPDGRGAEDHGVALADDDGAGGLLGHLAGLERDLATGDLDGDRVTASVLICDCPFRARPSVGGPLRASLCIRTRSMDRPSAMRPARSGVRARRDEQRRRGRRRPRASAGARRRARTRSAAGLAAAVGLEALDVEARARSRAPTGAGRRGGPGRRRARRANAQNAPWRAAASAARASASARSCLALQREVPEDDTAAAGVAQPLGGERAARAGEVARRRPRAARLRGPRTWSSSRSGGTGRCVSVRPACRARMPGSVRPRRRRAPSRSRPLGPARALGGRRPPSSADELTCRARAVAPSRRLGALSVHPAACAESGATAGARCAGRTRTSARMSRAARDAGAGGGERHRRRSASRVRSSGQLGARLERRAWALERLPARRRRFERSCSRAANESCASRRG